MTAGAILFFFFNGSSTPEIYTLSLHDALPIYDAEGARPIGAGDRQECRESHPHRRPPHHHRSEEHTSELQSRQYLVCRLLLEKKNLHDRLPSPATTQPFLWRFQY